MKYHVYFSPQAEKDLLELTSYITCNESPEKATTIVGQIDTCISKLELFPSRGHYPPELLKLGIKEYREVHCKPYRIIYQVRACL